MATELTDEQQKQVNELAAALRAEFAESESNVERKTAKKDLSDLKPEMLKALKRALEHGTVEQQAKVAMWGYGKLLDEGKADADPIRALIAGMPTPKPDEPQEDEDGSTEPSPQAEAKAQDVPVELLMASVEEDDDGESDS